jgi:hypothetical protein
VSPLYLTFYHAYAKYNAQNDSLVVSYTKDCGVTWTRLKGFNADELALHSGGNTSSFSAFAPTADSMWVKDSIDISDVAGQSSVRFAFIAKSDQGNTLYLDHINLNENLSGINQRVSIEGVSVYPNPAQDVLTIDNPSSTSLQVTLLSSIGVEVYHENVGTKRLSIPTQKFARGIYLLQISEGGKRMTRKICLN